VSGRRLAEFAREMEARHPDAYAVALGRVRELPGSERLDARTLAAIIVAMETYGHIDLDTLTASG
jgi:hypothetical protein